MSTLNLSRFDLLSVRLALDCAHSGRLTAAAERSHIALAAASRRLRELEAAFGSPLFTRHAQGLSLTAAGQVFVKHALTVLHEVETLSTELNDLRLGISRHIRLCASTAAINQFLPPLLARHAKLHPQVRLDLEEQVSQSVVSRLREGLTDIGIFVEGPDTAGLATQLFRRDQLVLLLPAHHRLARGRSALPIEALLDQDWISLNTGAALLMKQQQAALAAGQPLRLRIQVRSFDAVCHMVASGLGVALLPKEAVLPLARALRLAIRPLANEWAQRQLLIATAAAGAAPDPVVAAVIRFLMASEESVNATTRISRSSQNAKTKAVKRQ